MKETISNFVDSWYGRVIGWVMIGLLVLLPYFNISGYLYDRISAKSILVMMVTEFVAIAIGIVLLCRKKGARVVMTPVLIAGISFMAIYVLTMFTGVAPAVSFWSKATRLTGLFFLTHVFFAACLIGTYARDAKWLKRFLGALLFSGIAFSLLSWLGNDGFKWNMFSYTQGQGFTIGNTTFAGTFLILTFVMGLWYVWGTDWKKNPWWRKVLPFLLLFNPIILNIDLFNGKTPLGQVFSSPLLIVGAARAAALTLFAGSLLWIGYRLIRRIKIQRVRRGAIIGSVAILAIVFVGAVISLAQPTGRVRTEFENLSGGGRPIVWSIAEKSIAERPVLGWGGDNFDIAFIQHFDNRLFLPQYNEPWFDRAHNIFIDTLVDGGVVGLLAYLSLYGAAILAVWRVMKRNDEVSKNVAVIVTLGLLMHLLDIQTSFDTVVTFAMFGALFGLIAGYAVSRRDWKTMVLPRAATIAAGVLLIGITIAGMVGTFTIRAAEKAKADIRVAGRSDKRLLIYPRIFATPMDEPLFLWKTTTDFEVSIIHNFNLLSDPARVEGFKQEFEVLEKYYKDYLEQHPDNYRLTINLADNMIFEKLFDVDKLDEAKIYLDRAEQLVPNHPMPNVMRAVIAVYQKKFKDARMYIAKAQAMVPGVPYFDETAKWIDVQEKSFPDVDFRIIEKI